MTRKRAKKKGKRRSKGRGPAEYFLAAMGVALVVLAAAMLVHAGSCRVRLSDEIGLQPHPTPRPTPEELRP